MTPSTENTGNPRLVPSKRLSHTSLFLMPRAGPVKSEAVPAAFPWAASRRATVRSREYLLHHGILTITGKVECKRCGANFEMGLDLEEKLAELWKFIQREKEAMNCTAPKAWLHPVLPNCPHCGVENCVMPFFGDTKKKAINWLFLLLSQMLGCCTPRQLSYYYVT
ncbi:hypothetical protein CR513_25164, partial [Mucuna pruriens]